jgi:hypothetical protein
MAYASHLSQAGAKGRQISRDAANRFASNVRPIIEQIRPGGAESLCAVAAELNARGVSTARGSAWDPSTVRNVMLRTEAA